MDALAEQMPSRLLGEWMMFYRLEPRGEARADLRSALQTAFLFNVQVKGEDRRKVEDFVLRFDPHPGPLPEGEGEGEENGKDWKRMLATVEMLNAAFGGEDRRTSPDLTPELSTTHPFPRREGERGAL